MQKEIFIILILSSLALALFGGETIILYNENCSKAFVNITAEDEIIEGEFSLSDNCIKDNNWIYNCSCEKKITFTLKSNAVNTYTISTDYIIQVESEKDLSNIKILNEDIIIKDISYSGNTLELILSGEGTKEVMISVPKCPSKVYADDVGTTFICSNNIVSFNLSFSEHTIKMTFPVETTTTPSSDGGGSSSHTYEHQDDIIKPNKTDWKDYYKDIGDLIIEGDLVTTDKEIIEGSVTPEEEPEQSKAWIWIIISVVIVICVVSYFMVTKKEDN